MYGYDLFNLSWEILFDVSDDVIFNDHDGEKIMK